MTNIDNRSLTTIIDTYFNFYMRPCVYLFQPHFNFFEFFQPCLHLNFLNSTLLYNFLFLSLILIYSTVLFPIRFYSSIQYSILISSILFSSSLFFFFLFYSISFSSSLFYSSFFFSILFCLTLLCSTLLYSILYFSILFSSVTDPQARGAFLGLSLGHTRAHLWRALMESVCYGTR